METSQPTRRLDHKRLSESTGAIASLASGVSVLFGLIAAHYAPHGLGRFAVALHLHRQPLLVRMVPLIAGVAVALVTAASLIRFYSWWRERRSEHEEREPKLFG
jgi:hypothetical protein